MPLYEGTCLREHRSEELLPMGTQAWTCRCGAPVRKRPSLFVQREPSTGATVRNHFSLYREATAEIDSAYARLEADTGQKQQAPDLWGMAKGYAKAIQDAGEAPPAQPLDQTI